MPPPDAGRVTFAPPSTKRISSMIDEDRIERKVELFVDFEEPLGPEGKVLRREDFEKMLAD